MATVSPETGLLSPNNDNIDVIGELLQGYQSASQLKYLLQKPLDPDGPLSAHQHLAVVLRSFTHSLSLLSSPASSSSDIDVAQNLVVSGENEPPPPDGKSPDASESRGRSPAPAAAKSRRGCYKRRRTEQTWTVFSSTSDDNHAWRKYGQKEILNFKFPRSYLRCTRKYEQGCRAVKQVQRIQENPELYQITYIGYHTCKDILRTPQVVTESGNNWESLILAADSSKIPKNQVTKAHPIIKQEHLHPKKEEAPIDDFSDSSSLDPSLWSDLKDLSEAVMVSLGSDNNADTVYSCCSAGSLDFGIVDDPVHFGSADDFHFLG